MATRRYQDFPKALEAAFGESNQGRADLEWTLTQTLEQSVSGGPAWEYRPSSPRLTLSVPPRRAIGIGLRLLRIGLVAWLRRESGVTFEMGEE